MRLEQRSFKLDYVVCVCVCVCARARACVCVRARACACVCSIIFNSINYIRIELTFRSILHIYYT